MGFLTNLIPGGWLAYLLIGLAVFGAGSFAGYKARGYQDVPIIARAQTAQAQAEADTQRTRTALADQQKQIALDLAQAAEKARATETTLQTQVSDLSSKLATTEKARQDASTRFLDSLKAEPKNEQVNLSPPVRAYLRGVRDAQTRGPNPAPASDRRPDPIPVPARAAGIPDLRP